MGRHPKLFTPLRLRGRETAHGWTEDTRVLWVCDGAVCRSRTAHEVVGGACAGILDHARVRLTERLIVEADVVVAAERRQAFDILERFGHLIDERARPLKVMQIADRFQFMHPDLAARIWEWVRRGTQARLLTNEDVRKDQRIQRVCIDDYMRPGLLRSEHPRDRALVAWLLEPNTGDGPLGAEFVVTSDHDYPEAPGEPVESDARPA